MFHQQRRLWQHIINNNNKCAVFDSTRLGQSEVLSVYDHYLLFCLMRPARRPLTRNAQQSNERVGMYNIYINIIIIIINQ